MSGSLKVAVAVALLLASNSAIARQQPALGTDGQTSTRLLSRVEGAFLVEVALEHRDSNRWPDCSHLMHEVLRSAGLAYPYATSFEIFSGIPQFFRVSSAQPGDLIVWPGHVGLVVSSERHTFFSSTGSGVHTDSYDSDYWRSRGRPRFYRYIVSGATELAAVPSVTVAGGEVGSTAPVRVTRPSESSGEFEFPHQPVLGSELPESIQIVTEHAKPTKAEAEEAISELASASTSALKTEHRKLSIVLVRDLRVEKLQTKGARGWIEVRVDSRLELHPDGSWKHAHAQKLRWELRRRAEGWSVFRPHDRLYLPENVAVPVLAGNIVALSTGPDRPGGRRELARLAALLNLLLNEK